MLADYLIQVILLVLFPAVLVIQDNPQTRRVSFYVYISLVLLMGGFVGAVYSLELFDGVVVSGGSILYGAFMMTCVVFAFIERDAFILQNLARLVVTVGVFKVFLFMLIADILAQPDTINTNAIPSALFDISIPLLILGAILIIVELLFLFVIFNSLRKLTQSHLILSFVYTLSFMAMLVLDGVFFPLFAMGFSAEVFHLIIGGFSGKAVLAVSFGIPLFGFLVFSRERLAMYDDNNLLDWKLLLSSGNDIVKTVKDREERLLQADAVFQQSQEGIVVTDPHLFIVNINPAFERLCGIPRDTLLEQAYLPQVLQLDEAAQQKLLQQVKTGAIWQDEIVYQKHGSQTISAWLSVVPVENTHGKVINYTCTLTDISDVTEMREALRFQANHDALTHLPNRRLLQQQLREAMSLSSETDKLGLLLIDLDSFKNVNDSYGHVVGDLVLQKVAVRLQEVVGQLGTVYRLGGDEFSIFIPKCDSQEFLQKLASRAREAVSSVMSIGNGDRVHIDCCCGISLFPDFALTTETLYQQADTALYWAKGIRAGSIEFYQASMTQTRKRKLMLETQLREAIARGEIQPYFQPKVRLSDNHLVGVEVLARWIKPDGEIIPPNEFIPLAEETGLIDQIGRTMLRKSCEAGVMWLKERGEPLSIAVNVSPIQLRFSDLSGWLEQVLRYTGFPAEHLEIEITETGLVTQEQRVIPLLHAINALGINIALDDFGTGYSSLAYLHQMPISVIKIDRSFVRDLPGSETAVNVTNTIVRMGQELGCELVAEGVETQEQRLCLQQMGCHLFQGYLYSRPLSKAEFEAKYIRSTSNTNSQTVS